MENTKTIISALRARFNDRVIVPEDDRYDEARTPFYGGIDRRPAAIIRAASPEDIASAIQLARESGLELAVRSGGHSVAGHSVSDGGIVLDLRDMKTLVIDPGSKTAWADAGLTAGEYTSAAAAYRLATGFGDTGSVGLGGLTLGGGVGFLVRKYGLTIDDLLAADVVTADGRTLRADPKTNSDLFWAIRGGGGNFGVVSRFQFRLHEVDQVLGGILILPATPEVVTGFAAEAAAAPEELSTIANVMTAPPMPFLPAELHGSLILLAFMTYAGDPEAGQRAVAPFRNLAKPLADMMRPMHYPEMYMPEDGSYHPMAVSRTMFMREIDRAAAETILDFLQASDAPLRAAQIRVLGGAMARVPVETTAFAHRTSPILVNLAAFYTTPEERAARDAWVSNFSSALFQGDNGAYVNFMGEEGAALIQNAYPAPVLSRLSAIKARYDPDNFFHLNHNIPGESAAA